MSVEPSVPIISSLSFAHPSVHAREREPLTISENDLTERLAAIEEPPDEVAIVSTCLRHEIIAIGADENKLRSIVREMSGLDDLPSDAEYRYGRASVLHLFRVASGLCSPVVGEPEVLGQVRRSHGAAQRAGRIGPILDRLFREAIRVGRAARELIAEPDKGSIAAIGVDHLADRTPGSLVLIGAGEMANAVNAGIEGSGWHLTRVTRRPDRIGDGALGLDCLDDAMFTADVVVAAVTSHEPVITAEMLERVTERRDDTLTVIDLGMPPNVAAEHPAGIDYVGIDDLADDERHTRRSDEAADYVEMLAIEIHAQVMNTSLAGLIRALREKAEATTRDELNRALSRLNTTDPADRAIVSDLARKLTNRLLHDPLLYLSSHPEAVSTSDTARSILGIDDE